jgi:hypothetical protein
MVWNMKTLGALLLATAALALTAKSDLYAGSTDQGVRVADVYIGALPPAEELGRAVVAVNVNAVSAHAEGQTAGEAAVAGLPLRQGRNQSSWFTQPRNQSWWWNQPQLDSPPTDQSFWGRRLRLNSPFTDQSSWLDQFRLKR